MSKNYWNSDGELNVKAWLDSYPFLHIKDASCTYYEENTNDFCWLNDIPFGWVKAFGKTMCDELLECLGEHVDDFIIIQLKEKYATMRMYWCWADKDYSDVESEELNQLTDVVEDIIRKYEAISHQTCFICGAQDTPINYGAWIIPMCTDCEKNRL